MIKQHEDRQNYCRNCMAVDTYKLRLSSLSIEGLVNIENIPVRYCTECGEEYYILRVWRRLMNYLALNNYLTVSTSNNSKSINYSKLPIEFRFEIEELIKWVDY